MNLYIILIIVVIIGIVIYITSDKADTPIVNKNNKPKVINIHKQKIRHSTKPIKKEIKHIPKNKPIPPTVDKNEPQLDYFDHFDVTNVSSDEFIKTKKNRVRYQFITPTQVEENKDAIKPIVHFDQICTFKSPYDGMYNLRRFFINSKYDFIDIKQYKLTKKQYKQYIKTTKPQKYKCYSTYELKNIDYPSIANIMTSQSNILDINYDYSGFAPFHKY